MALRRWSLSQLLVWIATIALVVVFVPLGLYLTATLSASENRSLTARGRSLAKAVAEQVVEPMLVPFGTWADGGPFSEESTVAEVFGVIERVSLHYALLAELCRVPGAGHIPFLEAPEAFARALAVVLRRSD